MKTCYFTCSIVFRTLSRELLLVVCVLANASAEDSSFRDRVAPILEKHCLRCHNDEDKKGGLSFSTQEAALKGGESGQTFIAVTSHENPLLLAVVGDRPEMPKNAPPLSKQQVETLREWVDSGAIWPQRALLKTKRSDDHSWWSLVPLVRPNLPPRQDTVPNPAVGPEQLAAPPHQGTETKISAPLSPLDAFIQAKLASVKISPSPEADRRTLLRRLSFDLLGSPPDSEELDAFADDDDPFAYERRVDALLASPRFGERWSRHWLDAVHYGDTHGYDKDKTRPNAWPYRDYVIRAFNDDKPYDRFVVEQLAGDVLWPDSVDGNTATGFIAAGPWDYIGHAEVPESKIDGKIARNLDRDDMVTTAMNTFCSMTVQCARCHDHKFDPVTQADYYRLQANFSALDRADRLYDSVPEIDRRRRGLHEEHKRLTTEQLRLATEVQRLCGTELIDLDREIVAVKSSQVESRKPEFGFHSEVAITPDVVKWVQLDLLQPVLLKGLVYVGCWDNFNDIGAGFGFPVRFKIEASNDPAFTTEVISLVDHTRADFPNPKTVSQKETFASVTARYVRFTATKLALRKKDYVFALAEISLFDGEGKNVAIGASLSALDSIESPVRWSIKNLTDGIFSTDANQFNEDIKQLTQRRTSVFENQVPQALRDSLDDVNAGVETLVQEIAGLPPLQHVFAGMVYTGEGNFSGTGSVAGKPRVINILRRGDVTSPEAEVGPGFVPLSPGESGVFILPQEHSEGDRRVAFARWIVNDQNPLTWRSIVNRVWQHHFGRGLVDSPNDFGRMGQLPSHPELLDWLASEFRSGDRRLKRLHRLIVTSSTYKQRSTVETLNGGPSAITDQSVASPSVPIIPDPSSIDSNNSLLWRFNRRKLDAESLRDSMLMIAGRIDDRMGGPGFQDFVIEHPEHSPHYEYQRHDPEDPRSCRRSIYRFLVRSQTQPFMAALDCADPSMIVEKRNETVTALQALAMLNNKFVFSMSAHLAERVKAEVTLLSSGSTLTQHVNRAFRLAVGRFPTAEEEQALVLFAAEHGLPLTCRALFNLNEFAFVD